MRIAFGRCLADGWLFHRVVQCWRGFDHGKCRLFWQNSGAYGGVYYGCDGGGWLGLSHTAGGDMAAEGFGVVGGSGATHGSSGADHPLVGNLCAQSRAEMAACV